MTLLLTMLISLAVLIVIFLPLERLFPARRQRFFRPEWGTDLLFFVGQYALWTSIIIGGLVALSTLTNQLPLGSLRDGAREQPGWLQAIEVVLLGDLLVYRGHRLSHRVPFLWRFYRVHHTAENLDWLAAHREHPVDGLFTQTLVNLPAILLGFPLATIAGVAAFRGMWGVFIHSNTQIPLGPLELLFGSPRLHHWHHDLETGHTCNFANLMPLMDVIFGTYRRPDVEPEAYGVDEPVPHNYFAQLLYPLMPRSLWGRLVSLRARRVSASSSS